MYIVWSFLVFVLIVVFASNGFAAKQGIIVSSGAALAGKILLPISDGFYKDTGINMEIKVANSKIEMEDILAGRADVATAGVSFKDIIAKLVAEPNAITIIPDSFVDDSFHVVKTPEISIPLMLVTLSNPKYPAKTLSYYVIKQEK